MHRFITIQLSAIALMISLATASANAAELISMFDLAGAISRGSQISVSAYTLGNGPILRAIVGAAANGARVNVVLDRYAFTSDVRTQNRKLKAYLEGKRVGVTWSRSASHIKAIVCDGNTLYLSDTNFSARNGMVIADTDTAHIAAVEHSINTGTPSPYVDGLAIRKSDALLVEANVIHGSGPLVVESESFGAGNPTYDALATAARARRAVRLIVAATEFNQSPGEQRAVGELVGLGVQVRISPYANEKIAVSDRASWLGSANATRGVSDQVEWGMVLTSSASMATLLAEFNANWANATPLNAAP